MTKKITKSLPLAVIVPYTISFKALSLQKEKKKKDVKLTSSSFEA